MKTCKSSLLFLILAALPATSLCSSYDLRNGDVVPITFDQDLSTKSNQAGDTFTTHTRDADVFPAGTAITGHIVKLRQAGDGKPGEMTLAFDQVQLPSGTTENIKAVPIPLDSKYVDHGDNGRYTAKKSVTKSTAVGAGALGGLLLGTIFHKPFEGLFVGLLAGIAVAETSGNGSQDVVIKQGASAGVLFQKNIRFNADDAAPVADAPPIAPAESPVHDLKIGDVQLKYDGSAQPYRVGSVIMVPLQTTANQLDLNYDVTGTSIFVENDDHSVRMEQDSADYRIDGRKATLAQTVTKRNGVYFAPIDIFSKLRNASAYVADTKV